MQRVALREREITDLAAAPLHVEHHARPIPPNVPVVLAVCVLKGGTSKTTTSVHLASLLAHGRRTLLVDCDPQGAALDWAQSAGLNCDAVVAGGDHIADKIRHIAPQYEVVIVDTPPGHPDIAAEAMRAADGVIMPLRPTRSDALRVRATLAIAEAARESGADFWLRGLLTQVQPRTRSRREIRDALLMHGVTMFTTEIPQREMVAQSFGAVIARTSPYSVLADELEPLLGLPLQEAQP